MSENEHAPEIATPFKPMDFTEVKMLDDGILWMLNKTVFHPRGYGLAYDQQNDAWGLTGDGTESWQFDDAFEQTKFDAFNAMLARRQADVSG